MLTIIINMLSILAAINRVTYKAGTKIKIKYEYKYSTRERAKVEFNNGYKAILYFNTNTVLYYKRTIFVPEFDKYDDIIKIQQVTKDLLKMEVDFNINCGLSLYLRNDTQLELEDDSRHRYEEMFKINTPVLMFMNKNDFSSTSNNTIKFNVDEKLSTIKIDDEKDKNLTFKCIYVLDNKSILCDITKFNDAEDMNSQNNPTNKNSRSPLDYLSTSFLGSDNARSNSLEVFHLRTNGDFSSEPLILDATLLENTTCLLRSEFTREREVKNIWSDLTNKQSVETIETDEEDSSKEVVDRQESYMVKNESNDDIIQIVMVSIGICLIIASIIIRYYNNKKNKQTEDETQINE